MLNNSGSHSLMAFTPLDARQPGDLIRTHSTLKGLFAKARAVERLQILLDSHWATRMRYQQKRLIRQLQAYTEFATLTKLHCKVQPPLVKKAPPVRKMRHSQVAATSLRETAVQIEDPSLKAALERLAKHHEDV